MAEISVIIPVYNKEKYVEASLLSVLDQPFQDIEVIVINDGSKDRSLEIVTRIAEADARIRIIDVPNGGVSCARNIGLDYAQGNWIQFLDADDILEQDYFQNAMQMLKKQPADILFSCFTMVDTQLSPLRNICIPEKGLRNQEELCNCFIRYQYATGFFGYISNKLFSRKVLDESNARFPVGTKLAEDLDFYARLYPFVEKAFFWEGRSFFYLQTEENYLNNTEIDYRTQLMIQVDIKRWFEKSGLYEVYRTQLDRKISDYAGFILFYDNEEGKDLQNAYGFLSENAEVMACINPKLFSGFSKNVLYCLQKRKLHGIRILFTLRNITRYVYRKLK